MKQLQTRSIVQFIPRVLALILGALIAALAYSLFLVPFNIAAGGVGGISIIINNFTGWPIGTLYLVLNIPLLILGYFQQFTHVRHNKSSITCHFTVRLIQVRITL